MYPCSTCGQTAPLCALCLDDLEVQLVGVARARGYWWGRSVRTVMRGQAWPTFEESERVQQIARRKVADIARGDEQLMERLARAAATAARAAYEDSTPVPGTYFRFRPRR